MDDRSRWNARYQDQTATTELPSPPGALVRYGHHLPEAGVGLDLAGGRGGGALWLARRGLQAVLVEVSDVAIELAAEAARAADLALKTVQLDFTGLTLGQILDRTEGSGNTAPVRAVTCFHYLQRELLGSVARDLPVGATFMAGIATTTNLERNPRPSARFLLQPGELEQLVTGDQRAPRLEILHSEEGWDDSDHHEAVLVVRRPE